VDLQNHLRELEEWAATNKRDAFRDRVAFWSLKIPAILAAASAGLWAYLDLPAASALAGALAGLCVLIDGTQPRGLLRNTHLRAYRDLRTLAARMVTLWHTQNRNGRDETVAGQIIREAEAEQQRIAAYVRDADTALKYKMQADG
jgi:hypothetical protein